MGVHDRHMRSRCRLGTPCLSEHVALFMGGISILQKLNVKRMMDIIYKSWRMHTHQRFNAALMINTFRPPLSPTSAMSLNARQYALAPMEK